jgi:uncharacterized protein (TIGR04255 family)
MVKRPTTKTTNGVFRPVNDAHAILEAVIYFEFSPSLTSDVLTRFEPLREELKADFPESNTLTTTQVTIDTHTEAKTIEQSPGGLELRSVESSRLKWLVRIAPHGISIHCLDYSRWDSVWEKAQQTLQRVFGKLGPSGSVLSGIGLKYVDRFVYEGSEEDFDAKMLIKDSSPYITPKSLNAGMQWHTHSGWFQSMDNGFPPVLTQLNIDAVILRQDNIPVHFTTIDQTHIVRPLKAEDVPSLTKALQPDSSVSRLLLDLHTLNKEILADVLTPAMCKRINLRVEPKK